VVSDFEREFGIHVNYDVFDSNEILETRLLIGHTNYDVVVPSAYFLETQIVAGVYQKLDKRQLPNLANVEPEVTRIMALYDPGNLYAVDYMWLSTTGISYNAAAIRKRMPEAPLDSWRMIFDPKVLARFKDCGVAMLDAPINVVGSALIFLGRDPNSQSLSDLAAAAKLLGSIRPYLSYVDIDRISTDLADGGICLAIDWSGNLAQAREAAGPRAAELFFSIPVEGALSNLDVLAIPADAPHPHNAHLFINYLLRPEVAARNSNLVRYANSVASSIPLLRPEVRNDSAVYPGAEARARLIPSRAKSHEYTRALMRTWTRFKANE
jgi:putrescine transport system substrate-binding protein